MTTDKIKLACHYKNVKMLYAAYMPFVRDGGLFIPSRQEYPFGESVTLQVLLPEQNEAIEAEGKIIWETPKASHGGKPAGIGVQFTGKNKDYLLQQIETLLAGMLKSTEPTDTI